MLFLVCRHNINALSLHLGLPWHLAAASNLARPCLSPCLVLPHTYAPACAAPAAAAAAGELGTVEVTNASLVGARTIMVGSLQGLGLNATDIRLVEEAACYKEVGCAWPLISAPWAVA
jgi:hypothetical protein